MIHPVFRRGEPSFAAVNPRFSNQGSVRRVPVSPRGCILSVVSDVPCPNDDQIDIRRYGTSPRWADVVVHRGVAHWVEVAEDATRDVRGQTAQVLAQIDATLAMLRSDRTRLLQILIYVADGQDKPVINEVWDAWVPVGHPPVRAMVQAGLGGGYRVEMVVTAAAGPPDAPLRAADTVRSTE